MKLPPSWLCPSGFSRNGLRRGSEYPSPQPQPDDTDTDHNDVEVAAAGLVGHRAEGKADHGNRNDDPVCRPQKWNEGKQHKHQSQTTDDEGNDVSHAPETGTALALCKR
jgi:hypothetical protein